MQPTLDPDDPRLAQRPLIGMLILALPLVMVALTLAAYAVTVGFGLRGRAAAGPAVELRFSGCDEAGPVIAARLADMGIEAAPGSAGPLSFRASLPADPEVAAAIPRTLATPGRLEVRGGDEVLASPDDVADASVRMDLMMVPSTLVNLRPEAAGRVRDHVRAVPEGRLTFVLDGAPIGEQSNQAPVEVGEVEIDPALGGHHGGRLDEGKPRWEAVAAWAVVVDHPLPCAVQPAS